MNEIQQLDTREIAPSAPTEIDASLLAGTVSDNTVKQYTRYFQEYIEYCGSLRTALNPACLSGWRQELLENGYTKGGEHFDYSASAINSRLAAVKSIMDEASRFQLIDRAVALEFKAIRKVRPVAMKKKKLNKNSKTMTSPAQVRQMIDGIPTTRAENLMHKALMITLFTVGCRAQELLYMELAHIEQRPDGLIVMVAGKNKEEPEARGISQEAKEAIDVWLKRREEIGHPASEYIFTNSKGEPLSQQRLAELVKKYGAKAGAGSLTPHDARRFVVSQIIAKDGIKAAQDQAGHANINTTSLYDMETRTAGLTEELF